jgi:hypothetical protein
MGQQKKSAPHSRRDFFSLFGLKDAAASKPEMVKMLTADGKLVEIEKPVLEEATKKQKATNKEIFDWMKNPSKENNQ